MKRAVSLLCAGIAVGLAGGIAIGFLWWSSARARAHEVAAREAAQAAEQAAAMERSRAPVQPAREPDVPREVPAIVPAEARALVEDLAGSAPLPRGSGDGTIRGRVVDEAGLGVEGVTVQADLLRDSAAVPDEGGAVPRELSLEEHLERALQSYREQQAGRFQTLTDARGEYVLEELPDASYRLAAYREGFQIKPDGNASSVRAGAEVNFHAQRLFDVLASVWLPDGTPAERATIEVKLFLGARSTSQRSKSWSREFPALWLVAGSYELQAVQKMPGQSSSEALWSSDPVSLSLDADTAGTAVEFHLRGRGGIEGRVILPATEASADDLSVVAMPVAAGLSVDSSALADSHLRARLRGTDYVFEELEPGTYAVGVKRGFRGQVAVHRTVEVADFRVRCDLELPPLDPADCLVVRAIGPDGKKVRDLSFQLLRSVARGQSSGPVPASVQADGDWWLHPSGEMQQMFSSWAADESFLLTVRSTAFGPREIELVEGQRRVDVSFQEPAHVTILVQGHDSSACASRLNVGVQAERDGTTRIEFSREGVSPDGTARLGPLEPREHTLVLLTTAGGFWDPQFTLDSATVTLHGGENPVTLSMPPLSELRVRVPEGRVGTDLRLVRQGEESRNPWNSAPRAALDPEGRATFACVPPGEYLLESDEAAMAVTVPTSGDVLFEPRPYNALRVTLHDTGGTLAQWGLRDGDVIVGIDGEAFETAEDLERALLEVRLGKSVVLHVLRGRKRLELPITASEAPAADLGGGLRRTLATGR